MLIGHSRWAEATPGWAEPPHLWTAAVGDSGNGKSPGADCLFRDVLPDIEKRMLADFPDRLQMWRASAEFAKAVEETWKQDVRAAQKAGKAPPSPPPPAGPEPQAPRLRQNDVTVERVATLLATAAPKGLLIVRDELAGWIAEMCAYNDAGRAFWVESFGGRPYRVERQKHPRAAGAWQQGAAISHRLPDQPARLGGRAMSRWAEMFASLSGTADTVDTSSASVAAPVRSDPTKCRKGSAGVMARNCLGRSRRNPKRPGAIRSRADHVSTLSTVSQGEKERTGPRSVRARKKFSRLLCLKMTLGAGPLPPHGPRLWSKAEPPHATGRTVLRSSIPTGHPATCRRTLGSGSSMT